MHLRTYAFVCALLALLAAPRQPAERTLAAGRRLDLVQSRHEQPLPFLGSAGAMVQLPAAQPAPPLPLLRASDPDRRPAVPAHGARPGRRMAALPVGELAVSVRACRLGTPPPLPRSGRAVCPADPVQA